MTTKEALVATRALIADRKHWTHDAAARDKHSHRVEAESPRAVRWCAYGALLKVAGNEDGKLFSRAFDALTEAARDVAESRGLPGSVFTLNDMGGHRAILEALDRAIG